MKNKILGFFLVIFFTSSLLPVATQKEKVLELEMLAGKINSLNRLNLAGYSDYDTFITDKINIFARSTFFHGLKNFSLEKVDGGFIPFSYGAEVGISCVLLGKSMNN